MTDEVLVTLSSRFDRMYSDMGRPSIPPEAIAGAPTAVALHGAQRAAVTWSIGS
jgi:hypothetical protein